MEGRPHIISVLISLHHGVGGWVVANIESIQLSPHLPRPIRVIKLYLHILYLRSMVLDALVNKNCLVNWKMIIPPQNAFFYKGRWNPRMDELVLETAIRMRIDHPWPEDNIPESVAFEAGAVVEREIGVQLALIEVKQRLMIMHARYLTFKDVVATTGTLWVPDMELVVAVDSVWQDIIKVCFSF